MSSARETGAVHDNSDPTSPIELPLQKTGIAKKGLPKTAIDKKHAQSAAKFFMKDLTQ
jgi:hypothetical protein